MISRIRSILLAAAGAAVLALSLGSTASAQVFFPRPPCGAVVISNLSGCPVNLRFTTVPAIWPPVIGIPAGGFVNMPVPVGGITVNGITSFANIFYPFIAPPPPGVACGATDAFIGHVSIGPVPCCVDICGMPGQCAITIRPSPPPPACRP